MQVSDVMTQASVSESPAEPLKAAAARMWSQQTGSLLVMDGDELRGIITERDVMKAVADGRDASGSSVSELMTTDVATVSPSTSLHDAARQMAARWIRHLPVVDGGEVVGMISQRDLCGVFAALSKDPDAIELSHDELVREMRLARIEHGDLD